MTRFIIKKRLDPFLILFIFIFLLAAFLRLYQLDSGFGFFGDQGRDLLDIHQWFISGELPLRGPRASVGNFHLGPLSYYLLAPFHILFQGHPIGAVYLYLVWGLMLVGLGFILIRKITDSKTALIFSLLVAVSPYAIIISRNHWNPNLAPLVTIILLFCLVRFIQTSRPIFLFLIAFLVGVGVQFHYTFAANLFSALLIILFFKPRSLLSWRNWLLMIYGFTIPLLPFLMGQLQNNFIDLRNIKFCLTVSLQEKLIFLPQTFLDRLTFPFLIFLYFPPEAISYLLKSLLAPISFLILTSTFLISKSKTHLSLPAKIFLIFFLISVAETMAMRVNFYYHYYSFFSIVVLLLVSILISYLLDYARLPFIWLIILIFFISLDFYFLPYVYEVRRTPQVVYEITNQIVIDAKRDEKSKIGILVKSPVTLSEGFEHRYLLENAGFKTFSVKTLKETDYLIIEKTNEAKFNLVSKDERVKMEKLSVLKFNDKSTAVKYAEIYKKFDN